MAMTTPLIRPITSALDATKDNTIVFDVYGGNQVYKHNIVIADMSGVEVVNNTIISFQYKSTILSNALIQNKQYRVKIRTSDVNNNWSEFSNWSVFWCFAPAVITIPTIESGVINNQNILFKGTYVQSYDGLQAYLFNLYSNENVLLESSDLIYTTNVNAIQAMFTGLTNNDYYKIELKTISVNNVETSTGLLPFMVSYIAPTLKSTVTLTNVEDYGYVELSTQIIQIIGTAYNATYENSDWVNITTTDGFVKFQDGFDITDNFTLKIWLKNIQVNKPFLSLIGSNGDIALTYYGNRIHCIKSSNVFYIFPLQKKYGQFSHFATTSDITITTSNVVCVMIRQVDDAIDVYAQIVS